MEKQANTRMAMNILNFKQEFRYETEDIRPHARIENFLWVSYCNVLCEKSFLIYSGFKSPFRRIFSSLVLFSIKNQMAATAGIDPDTMPCPGFEGFEKRLEIEFWASSETEEKGGLRTLSFSDLDEILRAAQCTIVSGLSNSLFDSYILSESSLFIYPLKIIIKTCGTTQLLKSIPPLLHHAGKLFLRVRRCRYSRGTFLFPAAQPFPHRNFNEEVKFLDNHFAHLGSKAYLMGTESQKINWHVYSAVAEEEDSNPSPTAYTLEVCMTELDRDLAAHFYKRPGNETGNEMTVSAGINTLLPNSQICDFAFEPCGYSMNSIESSGYSTIHVTPEEGYSYASFEVMGYDPRTLDLQDLLSRVAGTFNPSTLSFSIYTNDSREKSGQDPLNSWVGSALPSGYECEITTRQELHAGGVVVFHTFSKKASTSSPHSAKAPLPIFPMEEIAQTQSSIKSMKDSINKSYRNCSCGLDVAATRTLQADTIPSAAAPAIDMGRRY